MFKIVKYGVFVIFWYLIDFLELVLDLIKANSAVQQNACVGRSLFRYMPVLYHYINEIQMDFTKCNKIL